MIEQIRLKSDGHQQEQPGLPSQHQETVAPGRFAGAVGPALDSRAIAFPSVGKLFLILLLAGWVFYAAPVRNLALASIAALAMAGMAGFIINFRVSRGSTAQRSGLAVANLIMLVAVGLTGLAGMTLLSPAVLILPVLVWSTAAVAARPWMSNLAVRLAVPVMAGIAFLATTDRAEYPLEVVPAAIFGASLTLATVVVWMHGRRYGPKLAATAVADPTVVLSQQDNSPLSQVRLAISGQQDATGIARVAGRAIRERFNPDYVAIVEYIPHGNTFHPLIEIVGDSEAEDLGRRLAGITESALSRSQPVWMMDDTADTHTVTCRRLGVQAVLIVPLVHLSHQVGAIQVAWTRPVGPLTVSEVLNYASGLSAMITPDLAIAQFATEVERGYFDAISALAAHVDDRDDFTRGHSRRVAKHALAIAEALDLDEQEQRMLLYAAELHDIGRIGVSEEILTKTEALSPADWAEIRSYPRISADIVEPLSFFTDVREVILHQSERWDGQGYPDHLAGIEIPLLSRILAVADAYDAMTSPRAYRPAMSPQEALTELWKARGTRYDPEVVEAFVMSSSTSQQIA